MFTIGYLTEKEQKKNTHLNYLADKGWNISMIDIHDLSEEQKQLDGIIIIENAMPITCHWLMKLKKKVTIPIYLLSEIDDSHMNTVYLQLGVDVCFRLKIEAEELYYTLTNLLTHYSNHGSPSLDTTSESIKNKEIELVPGNLSVIIDGQKEVSLTKKEYHVLELLYNKPCQTISYEELKEKLWESELDIKDKNYRIANVVFHLRNKIEPNSMNPRFIKTVRSKGYMLDMK